MRLEELFGYTISLNEVFDTSLELEEIDSKAAEQMIEHAGIQIGSHTVKAAYKLTLNRIDYLYYFTTSNETRFFYSYGIVKNDENGPLVDYTLTGNNENYMKILTTAGKVLLKFIYKFNPTTVEFFGAEERQGQFYERMLPKLKKMIHKSYTVGLQYENNGYTFMIITKTPELYNFDKTF